MVGNLYFRSVSCLFFLPKKSRYKLKISLFCTAENRFEKLHEKIAGNAFLIRSFSSLLRAAESSRRGREAARAKA